MFGKEGQIYNIAFYGNFAILSSEGGQRNKKEDKKEDEKDKKG